MKTVVSEVRTTDKATRTQKVVGTVEVPIYENLDELRASVKEEKIVALFNKMNKIEIQANERSKHSTEKGGKQLRKKVAFELCMLDPSLKDELLSAAGTGNIEAMDTFLFSDKVQQLVDAKLAAA